MRAWILGMSLSVVACGSTSGGAGAPTPTLAATTMRPDDDRASCLALDSVTLPSRTEAAHRLSRSHELVLVGGSEQELEAVAAYCDRVYAIRPSWYHVPSAEIAADLPVLIGGSFAVDHLGPEAYDALRSRVARSPEAYLDALDVMLANATPAELSSWWPTVVHEITRTGARDATSRSIGRAMAMYRAASIEVPTTTDEERATAQRLDQRSAALAALLSELDACSTGEPGVREGTIDGVRWSYERTGTGEVLHVGEHVISLGRDPRAGCFMTERLYGWWPRVDAIAEALVRSDPDISPAR